MSSAIVVGAGLAGLAAADTLRRQGVEVVVLEARDRVGGRVWSRGSTTEPWSRWERSSCSPATTFSRASSSGSGSGSGTRGCCTAIGSRGAGSESTGSAAAAGGRPGAGDAGARFRRIGARLSPGLDLDPGAREAIVARAEVSSATTADRFDASVLASIAGHAEVPCPSVAGGNQSLALALAAGLGAAVRLGAAVDRVVWGDGGVRVRAAGAELAADALVVAVPASVIDRIAFEPVLPERVSEAYAGVEFGHAAKLFVPLHEEPPPSAVLSVPERYWTWTATGAAGRMQPVVHAFAGSAPALAALRVAEGPAAWLDSLARLRPELALDPDGAVLSTWDDDPWVEAAYSTHGPGASGDDAGRPRARSTSAASTRPATAPRRWRAPCAAGCGPRRRSSAAERTAWPAATRAGAGRSPPFSSRPRAGLDPAPTAWMLR